jgi:hypothetical protein
MKKKLYLVHCVDTEGPLHEPLIATFQRLHEIYGIKIDATLKNLRKLQNKEIDLGGLENDVAITFSKQLLQYNDSWDKIDLMLNKIMSQEYRNKYLDSSGNGIIYNWHCMDNVGFLTNERRRDLGYGNIFTHYKEKNEEYDNLDDIQWHFHPLSYNREGHICNTSYDNSYDILHEILCRRLIDHKWFPIVNRAGFHAIRQDSSFFLEQWIPFDYSSQAMYNDISEQSDSHRFGDWRRAPKNWKPYHPSYNDYQIPGSMNRYTTKCLNIGTRFKLLDDFEIEMAFKNAIENGSAILSFTNHDFRDMSVDINDIYTRIHCIAKNYSNVEIVNSSAVNAMQKDLFRDEDVKKNRVKLTSKIIQKENVSKVVVTCENGDVFGSQPYLAIKTKEGKYYHDNFNEKDYPKSWEYIFDRSTMALSTIDKLCIAANDKYGNQSIVFNDLN